MKAHLTHLATRVQSTVSALASPHFTTLEILKGLDFWLSSADMRARLAEVERRIASASPDDVPALWDSIPFDVFSLLAFHRPDAYPNIRAFFPAWPDAQTQASTVGAVGTKLQFMTNAFIRSLVAAAQRHLPRPLHTARTLDYGVGFGRNLRMLTEYVPAGNLHGVDPFLPNVELCRRLGVKAHIHECESYPKALPPPLEGSRFDLVFLFSIFTHLSEPTHLRVLQVLHRNLADDGLLAVTIRPREAWSVLHTKDRARFEADHDRAGFAFMPIDITELGRVDGQPTFGETTIALSYVEQRWTDWRIVDLDLNLVDPFQLIVFLKKR